MFIPIVISRDSLWCLGCRTRDEVLTRKKTSVRGFESTTKTSCWKIRFLSLQSSPKVTVGRDVRDQGSLPHSVIREGKEVESRELKIRLDGGRDRWLIVRSFIVLRLSRSVFSRMYESGSR